MFKWIIPGQVFLHFVNINSDEQLNGTPVWYNLKRAIFSCSQNQVDDWEESPTTFTWYAWTLTVTIVQSGWGAEGQVREAGAEEHKYLGTMMVVLRVLWRPVPAQEVAQVSGWDSWEQYMIVVRYKWRGDDWWAALRLLRYSWYMILWSWAEAEGAGEPVAASWKIESGGGHCMTRKEVAHGSSAEKNREATWQNIWAIWTIGCTQINGQYSWDSLLFYPLDLQNWQPILFWADVLAGTLWWVGKSPVRKLVYCSSRDDCTFAHTIY
jgi:hypothetical protein